MGELAYTVAGTIHSNGNKFVMGVKTKATCTSDSKLNDSLEVQTLIIQVTMSHKHAWFPTLFYFIAILTLLPLFHQEGTGLLWLQYSHG